MSAFRVYEPDELGKDGYPPEWHATLKHVVRAEAGNRCVRCGHPYRNGEHGNGEWSPCDERCTHEGPFGIEWEGRVAEVGVVLPSYAPDIVPPTLIGVGRRDLALSEAARILGVEHPQLFGLWRILTVHHLDGDKANCRWWNLAPLCQRCHLQVQGRVVMARVWPWEHTPWFRPYVAGYYAHVYLGEDLDRDQVEARLDELLALERAA